MPQPVRRTEEALLDLDRKRSISCFFSAARSLGDAVPFLALLDLQLPETLPFDLFGSSLGACCSA